MKLSKRANGKPYIANVWTGASVSVCVCVYASANVSASVCNVCIETTNRCITRYFYTIFSASLAVGSDSCLDNLFIAFSFIQSIMCVYLFICIALHTFVFYIHIDQFNPLPWHARSLYFNFILLCYSQSYYSSCWCYVFFFICLCYIFIFSFSVQII